MSNHKNPCNNHILLCCFVHKHNGSILPCERISGQSIKKCIHYYSTSDDLTKRRRRRERIPTPPPLLLLLSLSPICLAAAAAALLLSPRLVRAASSTSSSSSPSPRLPWLRAGGFEGVDAASVSASARIEFKGIARALAALTAALDEHRGVDCEIHRELGLISFLFQSVYPGFILLI